MPDFGLSKTLWVPQRRGLIETIGRIESGQTVCLYAPTGGGKTTQAVELLRYALYEGMGGIFYINRRLLIDQTVRRFQEANLPFGVRAAGWDDYFDRTAPIQIASIDTEASRVYERRIWKRHDAGVVIVDEAHLQATKAMKVALSDHKSNGAKIVGLTATPIGLSKWYDALVVSGNLREYRECKAIVPAIVRSCTMPDMRKVKRNQVGEYVLDGEKKRVFMQHIVGDVLDQWKLHNPDARPTMAFCPGVSESVWLCQQFEKLGVNWAHVDATDAVVDGVRAKLTRKLWDEILERYKAGDIKGLCSRFKLREGLDVPGTFMGILATPIGSLASYIQTCGRILRWSPQTPETVAINDHAGCFWSNGSPNESRDWFRMWDLPEHAIAGLHKADIRSGDKAEPIRCPQCGMERRSGQSCPGCKFQHEKSVRRIQMESGEIREVEGGLYKPHPAVRKNNTQKLWTELYFAYTKKGVKQSFNQLWAYFYNQHGYPPPRDMNFMPRHTDDWFRVVGNVPKKDLIGSDQ